MSGFDNDVVNCKNWDFRQTSPVQGQATSGGDLPIGTGGSPEIEVGQIVSSDGSITVSYSNPNIDISAGSSIPTTIVTDTGSATPVANILNLSGGAGIDTSGSGNTITLIVDLTELPTVATTYAGDSGTATPAANTLTLAGGTGIDTAAAGSTVTFNFDATEVPTIATTYTADSGSATPAANNLNILGGPGVTVSGSGSTLTVNSVVYTDQTATTLTSDSGTWATAAGAYVLPAAPSNGELVEIVCITTGIVVTANTGQVIFIGGDSTSTAGTATNSAKGDSLWLRYRSTDTSWYSLSTTGVWVLA